MAYEIRFAPQAVDDLRALKANLRAAVTAAIETHLRHQPTRTSQSRIKRLRGLSHPQFRLRVEDLRVFYDVSGEIVQIVAIVPKDQTDAWLQKAGEAGEEGGPEQT